MYLFLVRCLVNGVIINVNRKFNELVKEKKYVNGILRKILNVNIIYVYEKKNK